MKKTMIAILFVISVTALPAMAANNNSGVNETLKEEQVKQQQDMKRKEMLDNMQLQAQKRKQQLQQQDAEIKRHGGQLTQENVNSSNKNNH